MIVFVEEQHDIPLVTIEAVVRSGNAADPAGREGLARHAAELMRRGAGGRTRAELDAALDALGASIDAEIGPDAVTFAARCLRRNLEPTLALLADVLARPTFDPEEHDKLRRESLAMLDEIRDEDSSLCARWFERCALAGHPYAKTALGTEDSLAGLAREDAIAWAARHLLADDLVVGFAGDVTPDEGRALADRLSADLRRGPAPDADPHDEPPLPPARRTVVVDKPDRQQTQLLLGHGGPRHASPDWLPLSVAAAAFGGTFTARLMTEVRVKRGWSYDAGCRLGRGRFGSSFRIRVFPSAERTRDTLELVLAMWEEIVSGGLRPEELEFTKSYLHGSWAFEVDTAPKRLGRRTDALVMGLPDDFYPRYVERIAAVELDQVNDAIRRWWQPDRATIVLTATAEEMLPRLEGLPLGPVEVVRFDSY